MEIRGLEATQAESARFVSSLIPHTIGATIVALSGDLGAGKTTFVQGIARALGVTETVTSPTFVLEKIYPLVDQFFARLIHIDAYRLNSADELHALGWDDIIADRENLVLVEWPEKVADAIPEYAIRIMIEGSGESREITYEK